MKNIRTTITIPEDLHEQLRAEAFRYHTSLNEILVNKLRETPEKKYSPQSKEKEVEDDINFFKKLAKMGPQLDPVKTVREERDR